MEAAPVKKICGQCTQEKLLTDFGVDVSAKDGRRSICRKCYGDNRSTKTTPEEKRLKTHAKIVADAKRRLQQPQMLTAGELHKLENLVRLADKHQAKLAAKVDEQRAAVEHTKKLAATSPSLDRVRALFYYNPWAQSHDDLTQMVVEMKAALLELVDPADELARDYLTKAIAGVEEFITDQAATAKEKAEYDQEVIDGQACQDAADAIADKFAGLFGEGVSTQTRDRLKALFQMVRAEAQQQHKTIKSDEVTATGANRKKISSRILEELTAIAGRLGKAGTEVGAHQSLENAQSLEWSQAMSARDMRAYVRELTARLEEARKTMKPEEYQKKYLELPVAPKEEIIVWKVKLLNGREEWIWSSGKIVRRGGDVGHAEIIKDAQLKCWVMAPSPAGAQLDDENKPVGKRECVQEDDGSFVYKVVDPEERWEQGNDGLWTKVSGSDSPWSKPEPITFKVGPAQPDAAHCEFRLGQWFTELECAVERGPDLKLPPVILPPLQRTKADSIAMPPPLTAEEIARESREPNRWKRHMAREKFQKEQEKALLHGQFIWRTDKI